MAQHVTGHPLAHSLRQARVHHPGKWLGQGRVAHDVLDARPEIEDGLRPDEGAEIRQP